MNPCHSEALCTGLFLPSLPWTHSQTLPHVHPACAERPGQERGGKTTFFLANTTSTKVSLCSRPARQPAWCLTSAQRQMTGRGS